MTEPQIVDAMGTVAQAAETFHLDRDGLPELVPLGLPPIDDTLGGLGPQSAGILAAATGVGKSSLVLRAMLDSKLPVGYISMEDGADVTGTRVIAAKTGIDSLRLRRKALDEEELQRVRAFLENPGLDHMYFAYTIAQHISVVEQAIDKMTELGVRLIWLDYIQEVGGTKTERRNEVTEVFRRAHARAAQGNAALMAVSQFRRFGDGEKVPQIYHLKESGDLENKARVILLAHKVIEAEDARVHVRLAKSTYGGENQHFELTRDESGTLQHSSKLFDICDGDDW